MIHGDIWNIWSQLSMLGAICENSQERYPCDRRSELEGHHRRVFGHLPVGGRVAPRCTDALGCASFHTHLLSRLH